MLSKSDRVAAIISLGHDLKLLTEGKAGTDLQEVFRQAVSTANRSNPWFTPQSIHRAVSEWSEVLTAVNVNAWAEAYTLPEADSSIKVGVINAGNIPLVGLHDLLSVVLSGHIYLGKNASDDNVLLPFIAKRLIAHLNPLADRIFFVPTLKEIDAVIATGSNNSARYFEYYFGKYPHIIRMNRNGVGVLDGNESTEELGLLGDDIFTYYGLGCRNISKLYVPSGYNFNKFFESIYQYHELMNFNKYMNNFDYNNSILLLKRVPFLQNGFLIIREDESIPSPISIVHYQFYTALSELEKELMEQSEKIQCISSNLKLKEQKLRKISVAIGKAQSPGLMDYADGIDTMKFLTGLNND
jgi:hypothetical protein